MTNACTVYSVMCIYTCSYSVDNMDSTHLLYIHKPSGASLSVSKTY